MTNDYKSSPTAPFSFYYLLHTKIYSLKYYVVIFHMKVSSMFSNVSNKVVPIRMLTRDVLLVNKQSYKMEMTDSR